MILNQDRLNAICALAAHFRYIDWEAITTIEAYGLTYVVCPFEIPVPAKDGPLEIVQAFRASTDDAYLGSLAR